MSAVLIVVNGFALFGAPVLSRADIVDGENALDELGQNGNDLCTPTAVFSKVAVDDAPNAYGFNYDNTGYSTVDTVHHRLFVADVGNNRVLEYDLTAGDVFANRIPDHVLGQMNFYSNNAATTQSGLNGPHGVAYDGVNDRLFVADRDNSRILVYDTSTITDGENASHVLGQTDFVTGGFGSTTQSTLKRPEQLAMDTIHNRLFVADSGNARVIVYDVSSITDGQNAIHEIGQPDFVTSNTILSQNGMEEDFGIAYDDVNDRIFVSDFLANRVTTYDTSSITDGENATNVLGEPDFTTTTTASPSQSNLNQPAGVAFDSAGARLFVTDSGAARVMVFDTSAIADNENAIHELGQVDFFSATTAASQSGLSNPIGASYDSVSNRLYVIDRDTHRIPIYDTSSITDGENATDELGQTDDNDCNPSPAYNKAFLTVFFFFSSYSSDNAPNDYGMKNPSAVAFDTVHHRLFVADSGTGSGTYKRVLVYSLANNNTLTSRTPNFVLGQTDFHTISGTASQSILSSVDGLAYDSVHDRLFVSDFASARVLVYDTSSISNGKNAAHVLGQTDFVSTSGSTAQNQFLYPAGLAYDGVHDELYVSDSNSNRVLVFDTSSITDGQNATHVLGQTDFVSNSSGTTQSTLSNPEGLGIDPSLNRLYLADSSNNRVLIFDTSAITDGENAANVLGQTDFVSAGAATTQSGMTTPVGIALDGGNNRLFVSESGNNRILSFDTTSITDGQNAVHVIGQSDFVSGGSNGGQPGLNTPQGLAYDSTNGRIFVADSGNNRVMIFDAFLAGAPSLTFNVGVQPAATACDGTFSGSGGTVALGTITPSIVASSDASAAPHICTRLTTNGGSGAIVTVSSLNAALKSTSTPADTVPSSTATLVAGTQGYGVCAGSGGSDSGEDSGAAPAAASPFNGSCTSGAHHVGALTTSFQNIWTVSGPTTNAFFRIYVKAAVSSTTPPHADYTDVLTFIATATY